MKCIRACVQALRVAPGLFVLILAAVPAFAQPFPVKTDVSIRHGNWYPLPVDDMKAAATDTALATISQGGIFRIVDGTSADAGKLLLEISLIGPAETAKLTMTLNLKNKPTYVSTSSISVHGLDHQGIYKAFEHIGNTAAQRLNEKIQALVIEPQPELAGSGPAVTDKGQEGQAGLDDPALKTLYDRAQERKLQYRYKEARVLFEQIAAATGPGTTRLNQLAKDELRYGLPIYEAKQWVVAMGSAHNSPADTLESAHNAENLFRQILAENSDNVQRTQEAQRFLDDLSVSRNALKNVLYASTLSRAQHIRMMMTQYYMETYECPSREQTKKLLQNLDSAPSLEQLSSTNKKSAYIFNDKQTGNNFRVICNNGHIKIDRSFRN